VVYHSQTSLLFSFFTDCYPPKSDDTLADFDRAISLGDNSQPKKLPDNFMTHTKQFSANFVAVFTRKQADF